MKYFAILKDSLRETIDSKVFFVVAAISLLAISLLATVSLSPNPSTEGFQNITARFPDGSQVIDLPIVGRTKATPSFTEYIVQDVKEPADSSRPWAAEYQFVIESRDLVPHGGRIVALLQLFKEEEEQQQRSKTARKTRARQFQEEIEEEMHRIQQKNPGLEGQKQVLEQFLAYLVNRLEKEARSLSNEDLERFIEQQLQSQGNWRVTGVQLLDLPADERTIKLKTKVPVKEGNDVRITIRETEGELNKFLVTVTPRGGTYLAWPHKATLLFGGIPLGNSVLPGAIVAKLSGWIIATIGAPAIMLLSCIITAFYIPNMLRKGTVDLLLAKPVTRPGLLIYKYIGGLTFMFLNTAVLVGGLWLVLGLRTGVWEPAFLYALPILTFEFALFYALSTLLAVLTRSPIVCILGCVLMWGLLWGLGWGYWVASIASEGKEKPAPEWIFTTATVVHAAAPHYLDLDWLGDKALLERTLPDAERSQLDQRYKMFNWAESCLVTSLYILFFLGLACWRFSVQDY